MQSFFLQHFTLSFKGYKRLYLLITNTLDYRADDGVRTRDLKLGKLSLCQLSYIRFSLSKSKNIFAI